MSDSDGGAEKKAPKWTPKQRKWPNGRVYWIASKGTSHVVISDKGVPSRFPLKEIAQRYCDELNAEDAADALLHARDAQ